MRTFCIKVERGGIGEEDVILHLKQETTPTHEEIISFIESEDLGYDEDYCDYEMNEV